MDKKRKMIVFSLILAATCSSVFSGEWKASVVKTLDALVSSCVVVPCSFSHPGGNLPASRLRGIWHLKDTRTENIYHEDQSKVKEAYKEKTRLLGDLGKANCTLEMIGIQNHHNGPFCFRIELVLKDDDQPTTEKFSFVEECVSFNILPNPPDPTLIHPKTAYQGQSFTVTCSVTHTCPSSAPKLSWKQDTTKGQEMQHQKDIHYGNWEAESILTIIPEEKDDHSDITCTAEFEGGRTSSKTMTLYVKRAVNYNYIIIPTAVALGTALIFSLLCIFVVRKYKKRIIELQSRDGSMWNRLSRMSRRFRSDDAGPSRVQQRQSVWSRFSRRPKQNIGHTPRTADSRSHAEQKAGKPRFPSPKSQLKSCNLTADLDVGDVYMNTEDLNVYGNI